MTAASGRLQDRARRVAHALGPGARGDARADCRLLEQRLRPLGEGPVRLGHGPDASPSVPGAVESAISHPRLEREFSDGWGEDPGFPAQVALRGCRHRGCDRPAQCRAFPLRRANASSRILTIALVCASLYAALLGAGAFAQDEDRRRPPPRRPRPRRPRFPTAPPAGDARGSRSRPPSPRRSRPWSRRPRSPRRPPRRRSPTRPRSRPRTPRAGAHEAPAQTRQPEQTPAATPGKPAATPAPKLGVDKVKRARKDDKHPNREQGSAEKCPRNGKLVGTVGMASTSTRGCVEGQRVTTVRRVTATATRPFGGADSPAPPTRRTAPRPRPTPATRSRPRGRPRSACRTSSSTSSGSRRSCSRSTRPPASQYGVRWEVLAAINEIETDYGRNLNISSAGALGLDAVHARDLGAVRRRRQRRRPEGPLQPGRRDLRRRALPARRGRRQGPPPRDLRLQPRRLVRRLRADARARDRRPADRPRRLADRPDAGPLPGRAPRRPTPASSPEGRARKRRARPRTPPYVVESRRHRRGIDIFAAPARRSIAVNDGRIVQLGHDARASAATSSSRTSTATPTPTRTSARSPRPTRRRKRAQGDAAQIRARARAARRPAAPTPPRRSAGQTRAAHDARGARRRAPPRAARGAVKERPPPSRRPPPDRRAAQAAPVRPPDPPERAPRRRRRASCRAQRRRLRALTPAAVGSTRATSCPSRCKGRPRHRRHRARPHRPHEPTSRPRTSASRSARPAAAPRASTRSRSSTAGSCSSRPRSTAPAKRNPFFGADAETPSIGQIMLMSKEALAAPRARQPAHRRSTAAAARTSAPARSTAACSRRSSSSPPPA